MYCTPKYLTGVAGATVSIAWRGCEQNYFLFLERTQSKKGITALHVQFQKIFIPTQWKVIRHFKGVGVGV